MTAEAQEFDSEMAHVLFMDVVGYSLLRMEKQVETARQLRALVRQTPQFIYSQSKSELIALDTGDGMALVFTRHPVAPVQCAIELYQTVNAVLPLRMGIHSGHISRVQDINGKENVYGDGINMAQRIMDCGDAGHILLSARAAEDLISYEKWASTLFDLGMCQVKHSIPVRVYNLYTGTAGNNALPEKIRAQQEALRVTPPVNTTPTPSFAPAQTTPSPTQIAPAPAQDTQPKVAILYKRHSPDDEYVRNLLEKRLKEAGYEVFIDLHMTMGVKWVEEIERQIHSAYAVVPLLSENSVGSEMLEYEVETAHRAEEKKGKPHLLPVRLKYHEALPVLLGSILNPLQYACWEGEEDNEALAQAVLHALENPPAPPTPEEALPLEAVGGAVPLDSKFYIVRKADTEFKTAVARRDSIILVKGGRQMGKTSLLARGLQQARESGTKVVMTDFQTFNESHMASPDALFQAIATIMADQLDLDVNPKKIWDPDLGPNMNLEYFLRRKVLNVITEPLMWGLDEVDRLFTCDFGSEVFGLFRSWHNRRSLEPTGPWSRLSLAIAYATEAHLFITDLNQSPFNVGTRLALDDFTQEQIAELNDRYGRPLKSQQEITRYYQLLGGQPYLVRRGLDDMVTHKIGLDALAATADRDEGLFGDHLRRLLVSLLRDEALTTSVKTLLQGGNLASSEHFYRLRTAGLIAGDSVHDAHFRCQLYASYMKHHLLEGL